MYDKHSTINDFMHKNRPNMTDFGVLTAYF